MQRVRVMVIHFDWLMDLKTVKQIVIQNPTGK